MTVKQPATSAAEPRCAAERYLEPEPRWPGLLALMAGSCRHYALPSRLSVGPDWLWPLIMIVLIVPMMALHRRRICELARTLTFAANAALSLAIVASLVLLIGGILRHKDNPATLLRSPAVLWITNVLAFELW